jgi:methyl-accepting chemotaxis protein
MPLAPTPATETRPRVATTTIALAVLGAVALVLGSWGAARVIVRVDPTALVALAAVAFGIGCLLAAAVIPLVAPAQVAEEVSDLATALDAVSRGDLTRDPPEQGETLREVRSALRRMLTNHRASIGAAREHARETSTRAGELAAQLSSTHIASQRSVELAMGVADRARTATEGARELATALDTVATLTQSAESERRSLLAAATTRDEQLVEVSGDLQEAMEALTTLDTQFEAARTHLATLDRSMDEVREFVALVRKMARQSKLLSLNAAMEAARAGEQGSGFAVVASEVRRLAKGSSDAADRTEAMLKDLLRDTAVAREAEAASAALVTRGVSVLTRSRDRIRNVERTDRHASSTVGALDLTGVRADVERLERELASVTKVASDTRLAQGATLTRLHDLIAAAHSLGRAAARAGTALDGIRTEGNTGPPPAAPRPTATTPLAVA